MCVVLWDKSIMGQTPKSLIMLKCFDLVELDRYKQHTTNHNDFLSTNLYLPNDAYRQASSEMKVAEYFFQRRDLLRRTNEFQHCLKGQYSLSNFLDAITYQTGL